MFNRILVATDLVTTVDAPVITAAHMARRFGARLHLLHVMESSSSEDRRLIRHFDSGEEMNADVAYEATLHQALRHTYRSVLGDIAHEILLTVGFPWQEILIRAKAVDADLIIVGPHSTRAEEKGVVRVAGRVGSTVENVVTRENCPVMIVSREVGEDRLRFGCVLVAVDFSRSCECAVCFAARLAAHHRSRLVAFHMLPVPPVPKYTRSHYQTDADRTRRRLTSLYLPYLDGIDHRYRVQAGAMPHLAILDGAAEEKADLIIMGSHTKEASGKWYPGSVVERVAYRANCPVVVITDPTVLRRWESTLADDDRAGEKDRLIHLFTPS